MPFSLASLLLKPPKNISVPLFYDGTSSGDKYTRLKIACEQVVRFRGGEGK